MEELAEREALSGHVGKAARHREAFGPRSKAKAGAVAPPYSSGRKRPIIPLAYWPAYAAHLRDEVGHRRVNLERLAHMIISDDICSQRRPRQTPGQTRPPIAVRLSACRPIRSLRHYSMVFEDHAHAVTRWGSYPRRAVWREVLEAIRKSNRYYDNCLDLASMPAPSQEYTERENKQFAYQMSRAAASYVAGEWSILVDGSTRPEPAGIAKYERWEEATRFMALVTVPMEVIAPSDRAPEGAPVKGTGLTVGEFRASAAAVADVHDSIASKTAEAITTRTVAAIKARNTPLSQRFAGNPRGAITEVLSKRRHEYTVEYNVQGLEHAKSYQALVGLTIHGTDSLEAFRTRSAISSWLPTKKIAERDACAVLLRSGFLGPEAKAVGLHMVRSQLNGANGEVTGTDDHPCLFGKSSTQSVQAHIVVRRPWPTPLSVKRAHWSTETTEEDAALKQTPAKRFKAAPQLNGANGEVTGTDDHKGKRNAMASMESEIKRLEKLLRRTRVTQPSRGAPRAVAPRKRGGQPKNPAPRQATQVAALVKPNPLAAAFIDPFSAPNGTVSAPTFPSHDTIKATARCTVTASANANGECEILAMPILVYDRDAVCFTASPSATVPIAGGPNVRSSTAIPGMNGATANFPMSLGSFAALNGDRPLTGRVLAVGLTVRATGNKDDHPGDFIGLQASAGTDMSNSPFPEMSTNPRSVRGELKHGHAYEFIAVPPDKDHLEMSANSCPWASPAGNYPSYWDYTTGSTHPVTACLSVRISGATAGMKYTVEYISHVEYTGGQLMALSTPNDIDEQSIHDAFRTHAMVGRAQVADPHTKRVISAAAVNDEKVASHVLHIASQAGVPGAGAMSSITGSLASPKGQRMQALVKGLLRK